jgi:hypothetical protein
MLLRAVTSILALGVAVITVLITLPNPTPQNIYLILVLVILTMGMWIASLIASNRDTNIELKSAKQEIISAKREITDTKEKHAALVERYDKYQAGYSAYKRAFVEQVWFVRLFAAENKQEAMIRLAEQAIEMQNSLEKEYDV